MKASVRLAGSWWLLSGREDFTSRAYQELQRMATSPFSMPAKSVDATNLFPPSKPRYSNRRAEYVADQYRGEA